MVLLPSSPVLLLLWDVDSDHLDLSHLLEADRLRVSRALIFFLHEAVLAFSGSRVSGWADSPPGDGSFGDSWLSTANGSVCWLFFLAVFFSPAVLFIGGRAGHLPSAVATEFFLLAQRPSILNIFLCHFFLFVDELLVGFSFLEILGSN